MTMAMVRLFKRQFALSPFMTNRRIFIKRCTSCATSGTGT